MVSVYKKKVGQKRFQHVKNCRDYKKAWVYVCERLMDLDYRLYYGYSLQYLGDGYTKPVKCLKIALKRGHFARFSAPPPIGMDAQNRPPISVPCSQFKLKLYETTL